MTTELVAYTAEDGGTGFRVSIDHDIDHDPDCYMVTVMMIHHLRDVDSATTGASQLIQQYQAMFGLQFTETTDDLL